MLGAYEPKQITRENGPPVHFLLYDLYGAISLFCLFWLKINNPDTESRSSASIGRWKISVAIAVNCIVVKELFEYGDQ